MNNIQGYLEHIYISFILPIINYFKRGTKGTAFFLLLMIGLCIWVIFWGLIPIISSNLQPIISITSSDFADFQPQAWQRYSFETDGAFPIGIRSWFEQREFGVITTYRSDDSYWGVYAVGDYYIYFQSQHDDDLIRPPQALTGRIDYIDNSTLKKLKELIPDLPDNVLPLQYSSQSFAKDISVTFTSSILALMLLAMAWFFHNNAIKLRNGTASYQTFHRLVQFVTPLANIIRGVFAWLWQKISPFVLTGFGAVFKVFWNAYQNIKAHRNNDAPMTITIDPKNFRKDEDE